MPQVIEQKSSVLAVGVEPETFGFSDEALTIHRANAARSAMEMLRMVDFDLLLVGPDLADGSIWDFVRRARMARPRQRWAMVGSNITEQDEIAARTLGVTCIFDSAPSSDDLLEAAAGPSYSGRSVRSPVGIR